MKRIINWFYGTNLKRYCFWHFLFLYNMFWCVFSFALAKTNDEYLLLFWFTLPLGFAFSILSDKYFCKCYQFKKNYNKELLNEKKNNRLSN